MTDTLERDPEVGDVAGVQRTQRIVVPQARQHGFVDVERQVTGTPLLDQHQFFGGGGGAPLARQLVTAVMRKSRTSWPQRAS